MQAFLQLLNWGVGRGVSLSSLALRNIHTDPENVSASNKRPTGLKGFGKRGPKDTPVEAETERVMNTKGKQKSSKESPVIGEEKSQETREKSPTQPNPTQS